MYGGMRTGAKEKLSTNFTDRYVETCSIIPVRTPRSWMVLFHLYPKDVALDADGKDLNASPKRYFTCFTPRLGIDVQGPKVGSAKTSLKLEADFRGSGSNWAVLRIRHAYVNLDWGKSAVLIGQTWHPLFGEVFPQMLNLSTGARSSPLTAARKFVIVIRTMGGN